MYFRAVQVGLIKSLQDPLEVGILYRGSITMSGNEAGNRNVFRRLRKVDKDGADITLSGYKRDTVRRAAMAPVVQHSIYISRPPGPQQRTRRTPRLRRKMGQTDRQTYRHTDGHHVVT